jgi:hypothetical protein
VGDWLCRKLARSNVLEQVTVPAIAAVGSALAALVLVATRRWGLGLSYDSVVYDQASHSLSSIDLPQPRDAGGAALYWWAPLYPVALKIAGSSYDAARYVNALLLLAGIVVTGVVAWRFLGRGAAVLAAVLYGTWPAVFSIHLDLLAEPLYLVFATATLGFLAARRAALAGGFAAAAVLTRYAGLPLVFVGAFALRGRGRLTFLLTSIVPCVAWIVRNEITAHQATGRSLGWHPPPWSIVENGVKAFEHLLITSGQVPSVSSHLPHAGLLLQGSAALLIMVALALATRSGAMPTLVRIGLAFSLLYIASVVVTITFFDGATPLNERLLVPVVPPLVFLLAWAFRGAIALGVLLCLVFGVVMLQQARFMSTFGRDYSGLVWHEAHLDQAPLPPGDLYADWPAAIAYYTGRSPHRVPKAFELHTISSDPDYSLRIRRLAADVHAGRTSVVFLNTTFLQFAPEKHPLWKTAPFRDVCRHVTAIVIVCSIYQSER